MQLAAWVRTGTLEDLDLIRLPIRVVEPNAMLEEAGVVQERLALLLPVSQQPSVLLEEVLVETVMP